MADTRNGASAVNGSFEKPAPANARIPWNVESAPQLVPVQARRTLAAEVTSTLRQAIQNGSISPEHEFPAEPELARQLGVSRGTLRQAITILEHEGLLSRRQGLGTFIVPHTARLRNVLNANYGLTELITSIGEVPGTSHLSVSQVPATERIAGKLGIAVGEPLAVIERVRTADGVPVAFTIDYVPASSLAARGMTIERLEPIFRDRGSLYSVLRDLGTVVDGGLADLRGVTADAKVAAALHIKVGEPLLLLGQIDYSPGGTVALYSDEYLPAHLTVQVWRKGPG